VFLETCEDTLVIDVPEGITVEEMVVGVGQPQEHLHLSWQEPGVGTSGEASQAGRYFYPVLSSAAAAEGWEAGPVDATGPGCIKR
jgi:hypothetical protein